VRIFSRTVAKEMPLVMTTTCREQAALIDISIALLQE